ncbi:MAG: selenide, water dikinase SelD [Steroidobacteraceae bacterium]
MDTFAPARRSLSTGLRTLARCGGCAAKIPPALLESLTSAIAAIGPTDPRLLSGLDPSDDAAVIALEGEQALVASVDFFPPLVDSAADYGAIAAANAVSDIYAMGGAVAFALALSGFPESVAAAVVTEVHASAAMTIAECGGRIIGGHSIRCAEPIFGLCVFGFVNRDRIWRKSGACPGDALMISKAVGSGLLLSAKGARNERIAVEAMRVTNASAARTLLQLRRPPHAVTDVSGFGLIGHTAEMAIRSRIVIELRAAAVPLLPGAIAAANAGVRTRAHSSEPPSGCKVDIDEKISPSLRVLLQDPQTSGGLLAAVDRECVDELEASGFVHIGDVRTGDPGVRIL